MSDILYFIPPSPFLMKKIIGLSLLTTALLTVSPLVFAQGAADIVVMNVGNDRYVGGGDISVNQPVVGDLIIGGGTVSINAPVSGSVQAVGGTIMINNTVQGNVRVMGGTVILMKPIKGNVVVAGGNVTIQKDATVGGSVLSLAGSTTIDSDISGSLKTRGGMLVLHGTVKGETDIQSDSVEFNGRILGNSIMAGRALTFGPEASIEKDLTYWQASGEGSFGEAVKGKTTFDPSLALHGTKKETGLGILAAIVTAITIYSVLSGALVIGFFLLLTKNFFKDSAKTLKTAPGMSFVTGLLYFLVTPILTVVLLVTVIGIPFAIALALLFAISLMFAKALTSIVFARYIEIQYKKKWSVVTLFFVSLGLFLALKLIMVIPFIGWIVTTVAVLMGYGAVLRVKYERYKKIM